MNCFRAVRAFQVALVMVGWGPQARGQSPFRYDDDVSHYADPATRVSLVDQLKYVPLGAAGQYLSFGADVRERVEVNSNALLGYRDKTVNLYDLHRVLVFADLQYGNAQAFIQVSNATEAGRAHGAVPTDIDRGDLAQGFLDYSFAIDDSRLTVRGGRFEMAYDEGALIGLRDGPNVRQVWDGVQAFEVFSQGRVDAFLVKPVGIGPGYFDDRTLRGQTLWGVHLSATPAAITPVTLTAFYYGNTMPQVSFTPRPGKETTHTIGLRLLISQGAVDGSVGGIGQVGKYDAQNVTAWAAHADAGWTLSSAWTPRVGIRADLLSGGDNTHGTVHTFNALYPNYAYSTEATVEAPANLIQVGGTLALHPSPAVTINATVEGLWRYSVADAFYAAPTFALVPPSPSSRRRFSGIEQQIEAVWHASRSLDLTAAYVHFEPGAFLRAAHAHSQDFGMSQVAVHF